jgi:hypothetical protein
MSIIRYHQNNLNQKIFWSESLSDAIRFENDGQNEDGTIYEVESSKKQSYKISATNSTCKIYSSFFDGEYVFNTTSLGFELLHITDRALRSKYIEDFWINNQEIINSILDFLHQENSLDRQFDAESLSRAVSNSFSTSTVWSEMIDIVHRIMDMLIKENTVNEGRIQGKLCISANRNTNKHLLDGRYTFVKH